MSQLLVQEESLTKLADDKAGIEDKPSFPDRQFIGFSLLVIKWRKSDYKIESKSAKR